MSHFLSSKDLSSCILFFLWPERVLSSLRERFWPHLHADKHQSMQLLRVRIRCSKGASSHLLLWEKHLPAEFSVVHSGPLYPRGS